MGAVHCEEVEPGRTQADPRQIRRLHPVASPCISPDTEQFSGRPRGQQTFTLPVG
jgi:hypothetical protein